MRKLFALATSVAAAFVGLAAFVAPVAAQDYPDKPVRLIIPFPPGGSNDVVGRMVAVKLGERLGKQIVVDNRAGAGGVSGTEVVAKSHPDGYTLLLISIAHAVNPALYKLTYDPIKSFTPVAILATGPNVLAVYPGLPVHTTQELVALAKQKPGELQWASAGVGSFQHLGGELLRLTAGIDVLHVPFKGGGPSMINVMGGHTQFLLGSLIQVTPHIRSGKLRALGTGGPKRSAILPDVPTIGEGVPGYEATNWWGIVAPAGTPPAIVEKLNREIVAVLNSDEVQKQFAAEGASTVQMTPAEFGKYIESETAKWGKVVKEGNIKAE
jgi:tripartite-type tricarboxylate transporter receptor subunit TctC